jgi:hypothetical protein
VNSITTLLPSPILIPFSSGISFTLPGKQLLPFLRGEIFPFLCYDVTENEVAVPRLEVKTLFPASTS